MDDYKSAEFMAKVLDAYGIDYTSSKIMCPFHGDVNPSMSIDLAKSRVFCFGCQKSYTAEQFIKESEPQLNQIQIYKRMAEISKGKKIQLKKEHIRNNSDIDFEQLRLQAEDYYYNLPKTNWENEWNDELDYMENRGFKAKLLNACGAKINYNMYYPIIFPIVDNGNFKGWVCRTTKKEVEAKRKYLYNTGFRRSTCLPGRYKKGMPLIIVEGYMDMLKMMQMGVQNIVALFGWKASEEQIKKIKDTGITHIVSALDNDDCGKQGHDYLKTLGFKKIDRWKFRKGQKDPGDQSNSDIERNLNYFKIPRNIKWFL